jgi:signal transduction histidine kinase
MDKNKTWIQDQYLVLVRLTNLLNISQELKPFLEEICQAAAQILEMEAVSILLYDEVSNVLRTSAAYSPGGACLLDVAQLSYPAFVETMKNCSGEILFSDVSALIDQPFAALCKSTGVSSALFISVIVDDRLVGALTAYSKLKVRNFSENEILLVRFLSNLIGAALEKFHLGQEYRRRARELEMLTLVSSSLRQAEKSEDMLPILVNNAREVFSADVVTFYLENVWSKSRAGLMPQRLPFHAPENSPEVLLVPRTHPIWKIAESGPLPLYLTMSELEEKLGKEVSHQGFDNLNSFALSSVKIADGVIALLFLGFYTPHIFPDDERRLLQALSEMGGNALQRAGMMETLEQRVADRTRELGALYDVAKVASEFSDLQVILEKSLDNILTIIGCEIGFIHLLEENGPGINLTVHQSNPPNYLDQINFSPLKIPLWKKVIEENKPLLISDAELTNNATDIFTLTSPHTYLGVPIHAKGKTFGVLSIIGKDAREFNWEEIALLSAIADQMGVAVESAHLRKQAERAAVMEERQRLARELHDAVTQSLYSLTLLAEACRQSIQNGNMDNVNEWINDISHTSHDALKEMRLLLYELRPSMIEKDGFIGAIKRRLEAVESRAGVNTHLRVEGECQLPIQIAEQLYRIVQEALNNILKHAAATEVQVDLNFSKDSLKLDIIDNGIGLNPKMDFSKGGLGLSTMKERAEQLGGVLEVESAPGFGTKISISMEIPDA